MEALSGEPIMDAGTPEESWARSRFLDALPFASLDELIHGCRRVVVVSPHPDDEVLGCGGLLNLCARQHIPIAIISLSDGEACYPDNDAWPAERIRNARRSELENALFALEIDGPPPIRLEIPDGKVAAHEAMLGQWLLHYLRQSDAVFVPWRRDGHPDHEAASRAALHAVERVGARLFEFPVWGWHWASADGGAFDGLQMSRLELDAASHEAKRAAVACFTSQVTTTDPTLPEPILPAHVLKRFDRDFEVFIHG